MGLALGAPISVSHLATWAKVCDKVYDGEIVIRGWVVGAESQRPAHLLSLGVILHKNTKDTYFLRKHKGHRLFHKKNTIDADYFTKKHRGHKHCTTKYTSIAEKHKVHRYFRSNQAQFPRRLWFPGHLFARIFYHVSQSAKLLAIVCNCTTTRSWSPNSLGTSWE